MKLHPRAAELIVETQFGPNNQAARIEVGTDGNVNRISPLAGRLKDDETIVLPGFVDIQVNGFAGIDFNAPGVTADALDFALSTMLSTGVTRCLPTLITNSGEQLVELLRALDAAVVDSRLGPLMVPGYHIEGPFLSPEDGYSGAHPEEHMQAASIDLVQAMQDVASRPILMMTVAPEVGGVLDLIPELVSRGIACALGHTGASPNEIDSAIAAGATVSTHLGNGLPKLLNKNENSLLTQLGRDQLMASFIADGIHIASDILQSWFRAKTIDRSIVVTDASAGAKAPADTNLFTLGASTIERHSDGSVRLPGTNGLAGSAVSMDEMVRNVMRWYGFTVSDVFQLARTNPLRTISQHAAEAAVGDPADLVEWAVRDGELYVCQSHIGPWTLSTELGNDPVRLH